MQSFERLTRNRQLFLEGLENLINSSFLEQQTINDWNDEEKRPIQRIFINASWGMGKTLFANALEEKLENHKDIKTIYINAWKMDFYKDFYKTFFAEINKKETIDKKLEDTVSSLFNTGILTLSIVAQKISGVDSEDISKIKDELKGEKYILLQDYISHIENLNKLKNLFLNENEKKVFIIDELDRCRPNYAIYLLEEIKHIFDIKNVIFIFLVNKKQLANIVSNMYMDCDLDNEYFEKFYDVELNLPNIDYNEIVEKEFQTYSVPKTYISLENNQEEKRNLIIEKIFIDMLIKNQTYLKNIPAPRKFKKIFKKFKILIQSLPETEKKQHFLILVLSAYFLKNECNGDSIQNIVKNYLDIKSSDNLKDLTIINSLKNNEIIVDTTKNIDQRMSKNKNSSGLYNYRTNIAGTYIIFKNFFYGVTLYDSTPSFIRYVYVDIRENDILEWCRNKYNFIKD
ncbi:KAP family P-loop NTPase fold protein [Fusobacterium polymorphum]|jgi:hypothetical protein|uniref:KAP NTPase domain-containing protein n=1 Tax=Fusobacterium nucleatum subsp. polymorphum TaxID=76857 RepID=A0A2C6CI17_FUSNP|nr:P-loop NTPase fold protein [Fusobacterium polymorphum]MBS5186963.1 AAA family ATPase [Fusobacterium nucleatum]PHI17638.1 hypothetical protein CBG56_01295 [Fusobacterium polymorphum]